MSLVIAVIKGYGEQDNFYEAGVMKELDHEGKKKYAKKLWEEDPKKYYEWKEWCIDLDVLPDFFGTHDNPIDIDESKL